MNFVFKFILLLLLIDIISSFQSCPNTANPPVNIEIDATKTISPILYNQQEYKTILVGNKIFLNKDTHSFIGKATTTTYEDSLFCPEDFILPTKSDYESLISSLGSNALNILKDEKGFNMQEGKFYLTNTKPNAEDTFNKIFFYIEDNTLKFNDFHPFDKNNGAAVRCMLDLSKLKLVSPFGDRDPDLNEDFIVQSKISKYLNGYLWRLEDKIINTETFNYNFTKSGGHMIEFWGKYKTDTNELVYYYCDYIYINPKKIPSSQTFDASQIKVIETEFSMSYENKLHFSRSNNPIAPRDDGGYYIAFTDTDKYLHVLSYNSSDILLKDFKTEEKAYPLDITATPSGFAVYMREEGSEFHSYLSLYNKNFELIKTVQIMNNNVNDDRNVFSNLQKQIMKYDSSGSPVFGMNFMYDPDNGKLIFSRGRIFLIFAHYNHFLDENRGHTGDTVVTFNEALSDMDFAITWGASHSLIQSATYDNNYFWTAALSDAHPYGIRVEYTSKKDFTGEYDPVNKKYNTRVTGFDDDLAGYIKAYRNGTADGKLGGMLYFENYGLYCLIYAKTPNYSNDVKNGKNIIYISTWKFENNVISNNRTYEIKVFNTGNLMQLRAGKYGNDKIFIIYAETEREGSNNYGNLQIGTKSKVYIIKVPDMSALVSDVTYDNLLMNTNEDLRTFRDGVLIWGATNQNGKLVIHKIGTPSLSEDDDDSDNEIIINEDSNEGSNENESSYIFSGIFAFLISQIILVFELIL